MLQNFLEMHRTMEFKWGSWKSLGRISVRKHRIGSEFLILKILEEVNTQMWNFRKMESFGKLYAKQHFRIATLKETTEILKDFALIASNVFEIVENSVD